MGLLGCPFWVALVKVLLCAGRLFALCVQPAKQVSLLLLHSKLWENPSDSPIHINHFEWHRKAQSSTWPAWARPIATTVRMMIGKDAISNLAWTICRVREKIKWRKIKWFCNWAMENNFPLCYDVLSLLCICCFHRAGGQWHKIIYIYILKK